MKTKITVLLTILLSVSALAQQFRPSWDESTRKMLITNMNITGTFTQDVKAQNAMLDTLIAQMFRTLGQDKEGNTKVYKLNLYYDKKRLDMGYRLNAKFNDYVVVVEVNTGIVPQVIRHPLEPDRELVSAQGVVPWFLKPTYELYTPTNSQIKAAIKNRDKDPKTYEYLRNGNLLLRKVSANTKKLIVQYSKK